MRILSVSAQKPDSTGSGVFLAQTARCMAGAGHEVAVVCGAAPEDDPAASLPAGALVRPVRFETDELPFPVCGMSDVMPYRATRYRDLAPSAARAFKAAFERAFREIEAGFEPDLVVCHHLYLATAVARRAFAGRAVCGISHSTDLRQFSQHGLERAFIAEGVRALDRVCALHGPQADDIARLFGVPRGEIAVVGTGYDAGTFNRDGRPPRPAGPARLLYAGKIGIKKGVESLLAATDLLAARGASFELSLAGGHNNEDEYARIVKRAGRCAVAPRFLGRLDPPALADAYRAADVFVLPSFFEGLPLVIAEALACGCAVVTADLPGIREFYGGFVSDAPILYVEPPRMRDVDAPYPEDLPAYERRLADAIADALAAPVRPCDASSLSWERLTERLLAAARVG